MSIGVEVFSCNMSHSLVHGLIHIRDTRESEVRPTTRLQQGSSADDSESESE